MYKYIPTAIKGKQPDDTSHVLPHPVLEVGSMVQFGNPVQYGVIKDIKNDPYNKCAVIETVSVYIHMHKQAKNCQFPVVYVRTIKSCIRFQYSGFLS